ncbi:MAG: polyprenyl synthetase family protein [Thermoguttaceae bacterium]
MESNFPKSSPETIWSQRAPEEVEMRKEIRAQIYAMKRPAGRITRHQLEEIARSICDIPEYLAWTMVLLGSHFWQEQIRFVPFKRRILLLPHCMKNAADCRAVFDAAGLHCAQCGKCHLGSLKKRAESLGYLVIIAEGSPIVMQWILSGKADAILGVGCLKSLVLAFDKLQLAGIPAAAVPLHAELCRDSSTDIDWILEMIETPYEPKNTSQFNANESNDADASPSQSSWIHLLRGAAQLFDIPLTDSSITTSSTTTSTTTSTRKSFTKKEGDLSETSPHLRGKTGDSFLADGPLFQTAKLGADFLVFGGKYYRPFITLAVYDALTGGHGTTESGADVVRAFPEWVKETAKSVEIFHKASLIHDDIEDDDSFRYGHPTLHRTHGIPVAINVGDYLLGLGYQHIAQLRHMFPHSLDGGADRIVVEMLAILSNAHVRLSEGQGAEMAWNAAMTEPTPIDILKVYVLKTAPAFEAALQLGVLLAVVAGSITYQDQEILREPITRFSRHLGVAFQIKNDLNDWSPDQRNKQIVGGDVIRNRRTLLRALSASKPVLGMSVDVVFDHFFESGVFQKAEALIEKYAAKAREIATQIEPASLRNLLDHFIESIASK